jgi:tetratricopeptide (TPR) repeat protein
MKGSVFYHQKKYQDAMDSYAHALRINANDTEALKMVNTLKRLARSPAGI